MNVMLKDRDELIRRDVELMETHKGKTAKAREGEEVAVRPTVAELIVRPLQDGHSMNIAVKITEDDDSVTDYVVDTNSIEKPLRIELKHLQEVIVRAKVTNIVAYDADQSAALSVPLPGSPEEKARKEAEEKRKEDAAKAKEEAGRAEKEDEHKSRSQDRSQVRTDVHAPRPGDERMPPTSSRDVKK